MTFSCFVPGKPQAQGSIRAFTPKGFKAPVLTSTNAKLKPWRKAMADAFRWKRKELQHETITGPCRVIAVFFMPPLKEHNKGKGRFWADTQPDLDKLQRALGDSLEQAGVYQNDSRVCMIRIVKRFAGPTDTPGVLVRVIPLPEDGAAGLQEVERETA